MASHDAPRSSRIRPDLPQGGAIPERGTPDAIVHLLRLARSNPILNGERLAPKLLFLAALLNQELPAEFQVSPDDSRAALAIEGSSESVAEYAAASIGKFVMNPAIAPALEERSKAFIGLHRYFTWCRGLWNNVEASRSTVDVFEFDPNTMCPTDDIGEQSLGAVLHWLSSLCVVIEGWEKLGLADPDIDDRLRAGGDIKQEGSMRHRLQRLRNGVFHFQQKNTEDARFTEFWNSNVVQWAIPLESAFERYFRRTWESRQTNLEDWLFRDLEPRHDPRLRPPSG
jgi:hypothetical protein